MRFNTNKRIFDRRLTVDRRTADRRVFNEYLKDRVNRRVCDRRIGNDRRINNDRRVYNKGLLYRGNYAVK